MKFKPEHTSTDTAIALFDAFLQQWLPPALHDHMFGHQPNPAEIVRNAIRGIDRQRALTLRDGPFAWAVFRRELDRDTPDGWRHSIESAVHPTIEQARNAHAYLAARDGGYYVIGEIRAT